MYADRRPISFKLRKLLMSFLQHDFPSLVALDTFQHEGIDLVVVDEIFGKSPKNFSDEIFENKTNFGDSVETTADMLNACAFAALDRFEYPSAMDLDQRSPVPAADQSINDPPQQKPCCAQPKRFFRTFWISTARRLLDSDVASSK